MISASTWFPFQDPPFQHSKIYEVTKKSPCHDEGDWTFHVLAPVLLMTATAGTKWWRRQEGAVQWPGLIALATAIASQRLPRNLSQFSFPLERSFKITWNLVFVNVSGWAKPFQGGGQVPNSVHLTRDARWRFGCFWAAVVALDVHTSRLIENSLKIEVEVRLRLCWLVN
jgi:hypothetical protein